MRHTEVRYLSAIGLILALATLTACGQKPPTQPLTSSSPSPVATAAPATTAEKAANKPAADKPIAADSPAVENSVGYQAALDQPVTPIEKSSKKSEIATAPAPRNDRPESPANREPSRSSDAQDQRVNFGKGESSTVLKGAVVRAESKTYLVNAAENQVMDLDITALEDNAVVQVITPAGQVIGSEIKTMNKTLPETGDYQIIVSGTRGNATYKLNVAVK
jgi:predicted small lipoprotein YifL